MLEGVLANMLSLLDGDLLLLTMETFYMLEGALANMLRLSARWRPFTCWRELANMLRDLLHVGGSVS